MSWTISVTRNPSGSTLGASNDVGAFAWMLTPTEAAIIADQLREHHPRRIMVEVEDGVLTVLEGQTKGIEIELHDRDACDGHCSICAERAAARAEDAMDARREEEALRDSGAL